MAEPSALTAGVATTGLTFFGVATGLDPALLIAGFAGGVWAQIYHPPMAIWRRLPLMILASIIAGYLAPATAAATAAAVISISDKEIFNFTTLQLPSAVLIGLTTHKVLGPGIMRLATKKAEEFSK